MKPIVSLILLIVGVVGFLFGVVVYLDKIEESVYEKFEENISDMEKVDFCSKDYSKKSCYDKLENYNNFLRSSLTHDEVVDREFIELPKKDASNKSVLRIVGAPHVYYEAKINESWTVEEILKMYNIMNIKFTIYDDIYNNLSVEDQKYFEVRE